MTGEPKFIKKNIDFSKITIKSSISHFIKNIKCFIIKLVSILLYLFTKFFINYILKLKYLNKLSFRKIVVNPKNSFFFFFTRAFK